MAEKAPKIEQPTGEHAEGATTAAAAATTDVVAKAKELAEAAQTVVIEQGDKVKAKVGGATSTDDSPDTKSDTTKQGGNVQDKVVGAVGGVLDATKTDVAQGVDKAKGYLDQGGSTDPATPNPAPAE